MDLEAQERNSPLLLCQKCFAMIPAGADFCAECGAPVVDDIGEGSDSVVYPELARANLLRMRGEYKVAEDICLAILRRHPNSATANTLLGDISAERGDLKQAAEWYEMALDITPDSESDRQKLQAIRSRIKDREAAETAKHLGLPESRPKIGIWVGGVIVFILIVATMAYLLGERMNSRRTMASRTVTPPVSVPLDSSRTGAPPEDLKGGATPAETPPVVDLLQAVRTALGTEAGRIVGASRFPDSFGVLLTFTVTGTEDARRYAAILGRIVLEKVSDAPLVTTLVMREGKVEFVGTIPREKYQLTLADEWRAQHGDDPIAFADAAMIDEWRPVTATTSPPPAESSGEPPPSG